MAARKKSKTRPAKFPAPLPPLDVRQRYSVEEACRYLRLSRSALYELIAKGEIQTLKSAGRRYIPGEIIFQQSTLPTAAA